MDSTRSERVREQLRNPYSAENKEVKKQLKKDKNDWAEKVAEEAQKAQSRAQSRATSKQFMMLPENCQPRRARP